MERFQALVTWCTGLCCFVKLQTWKPIAVDNQTNQLDNGDFKSLQLEGLILQLKLDKPWLVILPFSKLSLCVSPLNTNVLAGQ